MEALRPLYAFINPDKCIRCHECKAAKACPIKAIIYIDYFEPRIVDTKYCRGCGDCIGNCPTKAITLRVH